MTRITLLLLLLIAAFAAAPAHGQGACTINEGLHCAGGWVAVDSIYPTLRPLDLTCSLGDPGQSYTGQFGGGYQDFTTNPDGSLNWSNYQVPWQTLYAYDTCYKPCDASIIVPLLNCPSTTGLISDARDKSVYPVSALDGSPLGSTPEFDSGGQLCVGIDVSVGVPPITATVHTTQCRDVVGNVSRGNPTGAPGAGGTAGDVQHCSDVIVQTNPPPCVCGWAAQCSNNAWFCPNNNDSMTTQYFYTTDTCYPIFEQEPCDCVYLVQDDYDCGQLVDETYTLEEYQCLA